MMYNSREKTNLNNLRARNGGNYLMNLYRSEFIKEEIQFQNEVMFDIFLKSKFGPISLKIIIFKNIFFCSKFEKSTIYIDY